MQLDYQLNAALQFLFMIQPIAATPYIRYNALTATLVRTKVKFTTPSRLSGQISYTQGVPIEEKIRLLRSNIYSRSAEIYSPLATYAVSIRLTNAQPKRARCFQYLTIALKVGTFAHVCCN